MIENNIREKKFLKWLKFLQLNGINHADLDNLVFSNQNKKKYEILDNSNLIINSYRAPITNKCNSKYLLQTKYLHIYKIPQFLKKHHCLEVIDNINRSKLVRTGKGLKFDSYTDKKCIFENNLLVDNINKKMALLIGNSYSLPTLGMKYFPNDYKDKHYDNPWKFKKGKLDLAYDALRNKSITTWTFIIYLNEVKCGGETLFPNLNLKIKPKTGMALIWNNLLIDGSINPFSEHQSLKAKEDNKYIITKWFKAHLDIN